MAENRLTFSGIGECVFGIATKAFHSRYGGLDQTAPNLCLIYGETEDSWIGRWVTVHTCFFDVKFPKGITAKCSPSEIEEYRKIIEGEVGTRLVEKHQNDCKVIYKPPLIDNYY